jgi:molybdate transport system permease protein
MFGKNGDTEKTLPPAGRRAGPLAIISLSCLGLFAAVMIVLILSDVIYVFSGENVTSESFSEILASESVRSAVWLSLMTSGFTLALILVFAVPIGFALSRYRFFGRAVLEAIVDIPILLPPVALGVSLLAFFGTGAGRAIRACLEDVGMPPSSVLGIILCQFLVSAPFCIRTVKASFDSVDRRLELAALSLGCSPWGAFRRVTLPLASGGLIAGAIVSWARAIGIFGPLMVVVGTAPRVQVMPTKIWLELSVGNIEESLVVALLSILMAGTALVLVHWAAPGRRWM